MSESPPPAKDAAVAGGEDGKDSWVVVESPEPPAEKEPEQEQPAPETEPPEPQAEDPEPEPTPEAAEPEPEPEVEPSEPEAKPEEPQPEEPEVVAAADPDYEPKADEEPQTEAEPKAEEEEEVKPAEETSEDQDKPAEPAEDQDKPAEDQDKPAEDQDKPAEDQDKPAEDQDNTPAEDQDKPAEDKPAEEAAATAAAVGGDAAGEEEQPAADEDTPKAEPERVQTPPPEPGVDINVGEHLRLLKGGTDLIKVKKSKGLPRVFMLEDDLLAVAWKSMHKKPIKARIPIGCIKEVREGQNTDTFKASSTTNIPPENCFSLIYTVGSKFRNLDLAAYTESDKKAWVSGIRALLKSKASVGATNHVVRSRWLKDLFESADKDSSGTLTVKEVLALMDDLNVGVSKKLIKSMFKSADTEGETDGKLDFEEFCLLFNKLSERGELSSLFALYSSKYEWLTVQDLQRYLRIEQGAENPSLELCAQLVEKYEPTDEGKAQGFMSLDGFTQFMLGPENDIFSVDHREVYQDMSQPLAHYFIASSHNTYLLEDQLRGPSSTEAYVRALRKGCRCVELDCWDGPDNEPVIYHGHTLTSKILFQDAITAIKEHAFAVSPYPVILSIENHCSVPQQNRLAEIMEATLGELLYKAARSDGCSMLPSPADLMRKILVKGKKLKKDLEEQEEEEDEDDGEVSDEDEAAEMGDEVKVSEEPDKTSEPPKEEEKPAADESTKPEAAADEPETPKAEGEEPAKEEGGAEVTVDVTAEAAEGEAKKDEPKAEGGAEALTPEEKPKRKRTMSFRKPKKQPAPAGPKKKIKLSKQLSKLINYVQSVHFGGFDSESPCYHMSSFSESSATKFSTGSAAKYVSYNSRQISRTYPAGKRVDSSNYEPVVMWNAGCQIVALNYQTPGKAMDLNDGKFQQNGGSGYILKPSIMREELSRYDATRPQNNVPGTGPKVLTIKVISAQNLPKPGGAKEIIDPYVKIELFGVHDDKKVFKTKVVNDNGFNPQWKETFQMFVNFPEMALLRFKVMDKDLNQDDFIGSFTLPVNSIVPGNRHVHLTSSGNKIPNATIYVHIQLQDYVASSRPLKVKSSLKLKRHRDYPDHHLVGFQPIDDKFRDIGTSLRKAVDLREDYISALLQFNEACGYEGQVGVVECIRRMCIRATESNVQLSLQAQEEVFVATVTHNTGGSIPQTMSNMVDCFDVLNQVIKQLLAQGTQLAEELEGIRQAGEEKRADLKEYLQSAGPAVNYKKSEQVWDNYYKTMFTLKTVARDIRGTREDAAEIIKKCPEAAKENGFEVVTGL